MISDAILRLRAGSMAMEDAEIGVYSEDHAIVAILGPEPRAFDPAGNDDDRRLQLRRANTTLRDELAEDRRARETARVDEWSLLLALPVALSLFIIEWWASARVLIGIGVEPTSSLVLGAALASGVFALAGYCAGTAKRKLVYTLGILAFAVLIVSLTILRLHEVASDDADVRTDFASAVVLVVLSLGPAFLGELVLRRTGSALRARRDLRSSARQLREENRDITLAERDITTRTTNRETWTRQNAIGRAEYRRVWDLERTRTAARDAETTTRAASTSSTAPGLPTPTTTT
jgi:cation transport ATPase